MKKTKQIKNMLLYNLKTLIGFELFYKLISSIIFIPFFLGLFKLITKLSGYNYLTFENILSFLSSPLTILFLLLLILIIAFYTLIDISTIIIILNSSYHQEKISIKTSFLTACSKSLKIFNHKNILIPFLIIFLIPFLNIGISSSLISTISIPEFIADFILNNRLLTIIYILVMLLLTIILFRWLYSIHYFILEDCNFKEARLKSANLSKKHKIKDFLSLIFTELLIFIIYIAFVLLGIFIIIMLSKIFSSKNLFGNLSITIIWLLIALNFIVITLLSTPISYAIISALFYQHKTSIKEKIMPLKINNQNITIKNKKLNILKYALIIIVIISGTIFTYSILNGKYNLKVEYIRTLQVTAHRGASLYYPENTMSAFKGAVKLNADWIELDVQQTKDQELIVLHDTNLKRTTGLNKNTWQTTYAEIKQLDAGSFFSKEFKNERIPLLKEVIEFAKENNVKLNIELKPTGNEHDFEKSVVNLIKEYNFIDMCVITSQNYAVLEKVKEYAPDIKTVYVMSLAYGDITSLTAADSFSIEASSVTKTLVSKVHNAGKELYAWTVNTKSNITKMINLNVDNIITDNISLAKETIYESKTSNIVQEYIKYVNKLFN